MIEIATSKISLYFGFVEGYGHGLCLNDRHRVDPSDVPGFPWGYELLDAGLLRNRKVPDDPNGVVHWVGGGRPFWLGFFWWDRSGDKRGASNSGFYVQGFSHHELQPALDYARQAWPRVTARQLFPLTLQQAIDAHVR